MPVEGHDGTVFPPTFAASEDKTFKGGYNVDEHGGGSNVCLIDSVGSQAAAAFALRSPVAPEPFRSFDAVREGIVVAGRVRHAAHRAATASKAGQWSEAEVATFVLGHGEGSGAAHAPVGPRRFAYLPLPTIHPMPGGVQRVGATRRVLVTTFAGDCDGEVAWAEGALSGAELVDEHTQAPVAFLERIDGADDVPGPVCIGGGRFYGLGLFAVLPPS